VLWREPSDFSRCGFATLGFMQAALLGLVRRVRISHCEVAEAIR